MKKVRSRESSFFKPQFYTGTDPKGLPAGKGAYDRVIFDAPSGVFFYWEGYMETRVALIGIVIENYESAEKLNRILHEYGEYVIGRMGIPYREKNMNIISLAVDAPMDIISTISGKLGMLPGVSTKTIYAKSKKESP